MISSVYSLFLYHYSKTSRSLWKPAYSNILRTFPPKNENFLTKNSGYFHYSAQNIDCGYLCPQSMFLSRNKRINVYPCKPPFFRLKVGFKGVKNI